MEAKSTVTFEQPTHSLVSNDQKTDPKNPVVVRTLKNYFERRRSVKVDNVKLQEAKQLAEVSAVRKRMEYWKQRVVGKEEAEIEEEKRKQNKKQQKKGAVGKIHVPEVYKAEHTPSLSLNQQTSLTNIRSNSSTHHTSNSPQPKSPYQMHGQLVNQTQTGYKSSPVIPKASQILSKSSPLSPSPHSPKRFHMSPASTPASIAVSPIHIRSPKSVGNNDNLSSSYVPPPLSLSSPTNNTQQASNNQQGMNTDSKTEQETNQKEIQKQREEREEKEKIEREAIEKKEREEKERIAKHEQEKKEIEERERLEKEREQRELEKKLKEEQERKQREEKEEQERLEREKKERELKEEKEREEKEREERRRKEMEREAREKEEREREEKEREEKEREEREKKEKEREEREREEKENKKKEKEEREERERVEKERVEKEKLEKERIEKERIEKETIEKERVEKEKQEEKEKEKENKEEREKEEKEKENKATITISSSVLQETNPSPTDTVASPRSLQQIDNSKDNSASSSVQPLSPTSTEQSQQISASISSPVSEKAEQEKKKRETSRNKVIDEIISSEKLYVKFLSIVVDAFAVPLKNMTAVSRPPFTPDQIKNIFSNVEEIKPIHDLIVTQLSKTRNVASIFLKYGDFLKIYFQYVNNYDLCVSTVASLKENSTFQKFLQERRQDKETGGLDLMSYLIMPIQRIPRYLLLFRELEKYTPSDHTEHDTIIGTLDRLQHIAKLVNDRKKEVETLAKVVDIQNRISGKFPNLVQPNRRLIREGTCKSPKGKPIIVFLFNDLILWTNEKTKFKGAIALSATTEVTNFVDQQMGRVGFEVNNPQPKSNHASTHHDSGFSFFKSDKKAENADSVRLVCICQSVKEKMEWVERIQESLFNLKKPRTISESEINARNLINMATISSPTQMLHRTGSGNVSSGPSVAIVGTPLVLNTSHSYIAATSQPLSPLSPSRISTSSLSSTDSSSD